MRYALLVLALLALVPARVDAQGRKSVHLVVQQNGQALVTEVRSLTLPKGAGSVLVPDLPATIDAYTLQLGSRTAPRDIAIRDMSLDEEPLTPANLLRRYLGRKVTLVMPDGQSRDGRVRKEATVLTADDAPLFLVDGAVYSGPYEAVIYPEQPKGLAIRPRLTVDLVNSGPARQDIELTYLAKQLSWRMDYVLTMNKASTSGRLTGWVTLQNRSGVDFDAASVELLAGEPRSAQQFESRGLFAAKAMAAPDAMMGGAEAPEELFEYHLYRLKRPVTLADRQNRQVQLFESGRIDVARKLLGRANAMPSGRETEPVKERLDAFVSFRNSEALGLGLPLPKGTLRAFLEQGGNSHFLGEAPLERTPVGDQVELRLGQVFDVNVERVPVEFERTGKSSYSCTWELRLRNAKKQSQRIVLQEMMPGTWKVRSATEKWTRPTSGVLEFAVDVPAGTGEKPHVVRYSFTTEL